MMIVINVRVDPFSTNLQVFVVAFDVFFPLVAVLVVVDDDGDCYDDEYLSVDQLRMTVVW